ncbi:hypothetical protein V8E36_008085 [Tilletia maclaganii]
MASAFSSSDTAILTAPLEFDPLLQAATAAAQSGQVSIRELYDIEATASTILQYGFRNVALQFPDEALVDSVPVYWALRDEIAARLKAKADAAAEGQDGAQGSSGTMRTGAEEAPELYILADTSYGNCCVDEVAAAHVDADLVVHYGHTCLSATANLPALYVFPRLPIDPAHAASSLASFTRARLPPVSDSAGPRTLILAYDVAYAHARDQVLELLRASDDLKAAGRDEVYPVEVDTKRSFEEKSKGKRVQRSLCASAEGGAADACGSRCGACACMPSSSEVKDHAQAVPVEANTPKKPDEPSPTTEDGFEMIPLTSGRSVRLPAGRQLDASSSAILYLGPESRALTNLLLHLGPTFPVVSYDPTQYRPLNPDAPSSSGSSAAPVRLETGKTNRLLMQRYAMVQRARDASVVGLLVGTLGVASYLPIIDGLRARLSDHGSTAKGGGGAGGRKAGPPRKVYTVSVGKLNPAKLANFQEIEVWVLIACPENSLVGAKSGLGSSAGAGGGGGLSGANGHGGDFWRPIVTPFEMELALGPEGVWTGEYEVDLGKLVDRLGDARLSDADVGGDKAVSGKDENENEGSDEDDDVPHYSFVTGTYVSRTKYGRDDNSHEDGAASKPGTVMALSHGGRQVAVIQSASGLTHTGAGGSGEREWGGLTRPEGLDRFVPSVLEVGRTGIAGGYSHAGGEAEGGS